jgi:hypothetical protein
LAKFSCTQGGHLFQEAKKKEIYHKNNWISITGISTSKSNLKLSSMSICYEGEGFEKAF